MLTRANARVLDLFREWDVDEDGEVSLADFRRSFAHMAPDYPPRCVQRIFEYLDSDRSGSISLGALSKHLRRRANSPTEADRAKNKWATTKRKWAGARAFQLAAGGGAGAGAAAGGGASSAAAGAEPQPFGVAKPDDIAAEQSHLRVQLHDGRPAVCMRASEPGFLVWARAVAAAAARPRPGSPGPQDSTSKASPSTGALGRMADGAGPTATASPLSQLVASAFVPSLPRCA